jgi:nicotinate-nucleotide pyrophosphorylase (carboxylating)
VLIKENQIAAVGSVTAAVAAARRRSPNVMNEVEVETLDQLREAHATDADRNKHDDFSHEDMRAAVALRDTLAGNRHELEASGSVDAAKIKVFAATGVDLISIGALSMHVRAIDFSMRFV